MVNDFEPDFLKAVNIHVTGTAAPDTLSVMGSAEINDLSVGGIFKVNDALTIEGDNVIFNKELSITSGNLFIDNIGLYTNTNDNILIKDDTHIDGNLYVNGNIENDGLINFSDLYIKDNIHIGQNESDNSYVFLGHTNFSTHVYKLIKLELHLVQITYILFHHELPLIIH